MFCHTSHPCYFCLLALKKSVSHCVAISSQEVEVVEGVQNLLSKTLDEAVEQIRYVCVYAGN